MLFTADNGSIGVYLIATLALAAGSMLPAIPLTIQILSRRSIRRAVSSQVSLDLIQTIEKSEQLMERMERLQRESNVQKLISDNLPQIVSDKFEVVRREVGESLNYFETRFATLIDSRMDGVLKSLSKDLKGLQGSLEEGLSRSQKDIKPGAVMAEEDQQQLIDAVQSLETQLRAMDRPGKIPGESPVLHRPLHSEPDAPAKSSGEEQSNHDSSTNGKEEPSFDELPRGEEEKESAPPEPKPVQAAKTSTRRKSAPIPDAAPEAEKPPPGAGGGSATSRVRPAHLIVSAFVGGSQRIYIRGDGPGMSREHGIPLTMSGIGEWSWVSPLEEPFRFTLWLDNKTADRNGELTIGPGERKVVEPRFGEE